MRALVFDRYHSAPSLQDVPVPVPGPAEVRLRVAGSGACHSDLHVFRTFDEQSGPPQLAPSFTLGHEVSGWVDEVGPGVENVAAGSAHLVYGPTGCARCVRCAQGQDNYCQNVRDNPSLAIGLGRDGGMAEYVIVPARNLVPLGDADAVLAAPLADAALTPYHAIKKALPTLASPTATVLVIGLGGLGLVALDILRAMTGATVLATDRRADALRQAEMHGATPLDDESPVDEQLRNRTSGHGVDLVLDFVGAASTIALALRSVAVGGRVTVVGAGGGRVPWGFGATPHGVELTTTYWGSLSELHEVVGLYSSGALMLDTQVFSLEEAPSAYRQLEAGELVGRAVISPNAR